MCCFLRLYCVPVFNRHHKRHFCFSGLFSVPGCSVSTKRRFCGGDSVMSIGSFSLGFCCVSVPGCAGFCCCPPSPLFVLVVSF